MARKPARKAASVDPPIVAAVDKGPNLKELEARIEKLERAVCLGEAGARSLYAGD